MSTNGVVIAGLPATGKTTYLALIYHAIVEEKADGLHLGRFDDDREYVTEISGALLGGERALHTQVDDERAVSLSLKYLDQENLRLQIPDLSGEIWEHALVERRWSKSLADAIADADGFMVFVHPTEVNEGLTIMDMAQAGDILVDRADGDLDRAQGDSTTDTDLDVEDDEGAGYKQLTQVSLVELVQFFLATCRRRPLRISIVISAWDRANEATPTKWITKHAPLLGQFLSVNGDEIEGAIFGVSAQGGDFADEAVRDKLLDEHPVTRAYAHAATGATVGVAAPICWVLRLDQ